MGEVGNVYGGNVCKFQKWIGHKNALNMMLVVALNVGPLFFSL